MPALKWPDRRIRLYDWRLAADFAAYAIAEGLPYPTSVTLTSGKGLHLSLTVDTAQQVEEWADTVQGDVEWEDHDDGTRTWRTAGLVEVPTSYTTDETVHVEVYSPAMPHLQAVPA